jgi:uncharacterized membrane protein YbhN (UPF0104 family)
MRRKQWLQAVLYVLLLSIAVLLLYRALRGYSFDELVSSVAAIPARRVALAAMFAAASYLCITGYDWLALQYVGSRLPYRYAALTSFVALSLGMNVGFSVLSTGAVRYRFYARWGFSAGDIARIIVFCSITVALGLLILGSIALLLWTDLAVSVTRLPRAAVIAVGSTCLVLWVGYLAAAATLRRAVRIGNWEIALPPLRLAIGQAIIGPLNGLCVATCLYHLLAGLAEVSYLSVVSIYVIANAASIISHVPGGLGVFETVVLFLLPKGLMIGAVLAFRAIYFLIPLCIGAVVFVLAEFLLRPTERLESVKAPHAP